MWGDVVLLCLAHKVEIREEKKTLQVSNCIMCQQGLWGVTLCADNPLPPQNVWAALCDHAEAATQRDVASPSSITLERQLDGKHSGRRGAAPPSAPGRCNLFLEPSLRQQLGMVAWHWLIRHHTYCSLMPSHPPCWTMLFQHLGGILRSTVGQ